MTYQEAKAYVEESKKRGSVLGLSNMHALMNELGNPQNAIPTIHIAGTNGKGSVSNMLASVLASSGIKTGLYTSPHILDFRERMRVVCDDSYELVSKEYVCLSFR